MIFQVVVSNKTHPEYGQATIPFPIPASEYDHTIELLEGLDIGSPTAQDCQVDKLDGPYPILNRLEAQSVNLDELDYLAKRLESFCKDEGIQFQAMASKLGLSDIKDSINLTFCCQQATSSEQAPYPSSRRRRQGSLISLLLLSKSKPLRWVLIWFCAVPADRTHLDLIQSGAGVVTPYGVVYDNGMELEQLYTGGSFPQYLHGDPLLTLGVPIQPEIGGPVETAWLYLPAPEQQIARTLCRIGIINNDAAYYIENSTLPPKIFEILERPDDAIPDLNRLCQAIRGLEAAEVEKLEAVVLMAQPTEAGEIRQLADNLDQFEFVSDIQTLEEYGRYMIQESGDFKYDENLEDFYDYRLYGEIRSREDGGEFTELGYVAYHGSLTLEELMRDDPAEQHRQGPQIGGHKKS